MKKTILSLFLVVFVLLAFSCKTTPTEVTEEHFREIFNRHSRNLILDGAQEYVVQSGNTLHHIATQFYQEGYYYPLILLASRDVVVDPNLIIPGMKLTIPDLQKNLENNASKRSLKRVLSDCSDLERARGWEDGAEKLKALANTL